VLSSKIEGTQASIIDIFQFDIGEVDDREKESKRVIEVVNYMSSLDQCLNDVRKRKPINIDMITKAHKILLHDVRGKELNPGKIRTEQNWIGSEAFSDIKYALFVPPPPENIKELLDALVDFIQNSPGRIPVVVQGAIIHYLFEAIHPFADGNGRIGRLLILLLLADRNILQYPLLYLSAYFESHKTQYYSLLLRVSQNSDWAQWIIFFLHAIISQARAAKDSIQKLTTLRSTYEQKLKQKRSHNLSMAVDRLFSTPMITIPALASHLELTYHGAQDIVDSLKEIGILKELGRRQRSKVFGAPEILEIVT
jgi:Fic family protein